MPSLRADIITRRTYCRELENGDFENWAEVVDRVIKHQEWLWQRAGGRVDYLELEELRSLFLSRKGLPSGRSLWLANTEVSRRRESSSFNCSALHVETTNDVVDALWLLLQGCGVGFRPVYGTLSGFTRRIPNVTHMQSVRTTPDGDANNREAWDPASKTWTLVVGDSAEAWAKSIGKLLAGKYAADTLVLDTTNIRPAGQRLAGYGWISQGDEQLVKAFNEIIAILNRRAGQLLSRIDILDIINWLGTVLSTRRSAEIALLTHGEPEWYEFATAKKDYWKDNPQRAQSNNSLVFYDRPDLAKISSLMNMIVESGGSEPGFVNGNAALNRAPWFKLFNPCVPGDTNILTSDGHVEIESVVGKSVRVWDGDQFTAVTPYSTGINPIVRVEFSDGTFLRCTPYHKFVLMDDRRLEAKDLRAGDKLAKFDMPVIHSGKDPIIDAYSQGFYAGDGNAGYSFSWLYSTKFSCMEYLKGTFSAPWHDRIRWQHGQMLDKNFVPVGATSDYCLQWLAGLLDADGTVCLNPNSSMLQLTSINLDFLRQIRLMLIRLGVQAKLSLMNEHGYRNLPNGKGGHDQYYCQQSWRLLINASDTEKLIDLGLNCHRLIIERNSPNRDARRFVVVTDVVDENTTEETFCFTNNRNGLGTFNGIVTAQCAEILLGNRSFCNLVELDIAAFKGNNNGMHRAVYLLGRANYRATLVNLDDGILQRSWHENNEYLRLCGVGITGIVRRPDLTAYDLRAIRNHAISGAYSMARELDLQLPKLVTTIKPSGTLSKIMDTTEGLHRPLGKYILNNVSFSKYDPLVAALREANYKTFDHPYSSDSVLVTLPTSYEDVAFTNVDGVEVNLEPAVQQLDRYKWVMENYVDHNASNTISYSNDEIDSIAGWLDKNWDAYVAVSFLPRNDPTKSAEDLGHPYLPQEVVTGKVYSDYVSKLKKPAIDLGGEFINVEDCATGACPVR